MKNQKDSVNVSARGNESKPVGMSKPKGNRDKVRYSEVPETAPNDVKNKGRIQSIGKTHSSALRKTEVNRP